MPCKCKLGNEPEVIFCTGYVTYAYAYHYMMHFCYHLEHIHSARDMVQIVLTLFWNSLYQTVIKCIIIYCTVWHTHTVATYHDSVFTSEEVILSLNNLCFYVQYRASDWTNSTFVWTAMNRTSTPVSVPVSAWRFSQNSHLLCHMVLFQMCKKDKSLFKNFHGQYWKQWLWNAAKDPKYRPRMADVLIKLNSNSPSSCSCI